MCGSRGSCCEQAGEFARKLIQIPSYSCTSSMSCARLLWNAVDCEVFLLRIISEARTKFALAASVVPSPATRRPTMTSVSFDPSLRPRRPPHWPPSMPRRSLEQRGGAGRAGRHAAGPGRGAAGVRAAGRRLFYREGHRRLFRAMRRLVEQRVVIDHVTLRDELDRRGELESRRWRGLPRRADRRRAHRGEPGGPRRHRPGEGDRSGS